MHVVTTARTFHASLADSWDVVDDFGGIAQHHPLVERSPITNGIERGLGAERVCELPNGRAIHERVVKHDVEKGYEVEITDPGPFPLKSGHGRIEVEPESVSRTRVRFTIEFEPKYGLLGDLMARLVMKRQFRKAIESVLRSMDQSLRVRPLAAA